LRRAAIRLAPLCFVLSLTTCIEDLTAPGDCPTFCPVGAITIIDTVLTGTVFGDSSYGRPDGYVDPDDAPGLLAVDEPSLSRDSRPIFRTTPLPTRVRVGIDTTTGLVTGVDSLRLSITLFNRDTATHDNLGLTLYRLPLTIDSSTTFADLAGQFSGPPVRTVNLDTLIARAANEDSLLRDPLTGDILVVGATSLTLRLRLDSAQVPLVPADSGRLAFGVRATATPEASVAVGAFESRGGGPVVVWYLKADSAGKTVHPLPQLRSTARPTGFDGFVFLPPPSPIGADLIVGGVPSVRTILRFNIPRAIRDSGRVILATLELIPTTPPVGVPADSFRVIAKSVVADFGAKSPLNESLTDTTIIRIVPVDTIRLNVTNIMISWGLSGALPTTLFLMQQPEGAVFPELRFHSSNDAPYRPRLHVTYAPRYPASIK